MKNALFISGIFVLSSCLTYSQGVEMEFTKENPNPTFIQGHIPFLCIDFNSTNFNFFADFGLKGKVGRFYGEADYRLCYLNGLEQSSDDGYEITGNSIYEYELPKSVRINLGYMFIRKEVPASINFKMKSEGRTTYYVKAPSTKSYFLMADAGINKGFNWLDCKDKQVTFEGVNVPAGFEGPEPRLVRTMMDYTTLQIGISTGSIGYWEADIKDYGHRRTERFKRFYLDMIILLNSTLDPINYKQEGYEEQKYVQYNIDNSPRQNIGVCLGASINDISRFGIEMGAEAGYYPGLKGTFGSCFGFSIKSAFSWGKILN